MSKILNLSSIIVPLGFMVSTIYEKVYYQEYGKFSRFTFFILCIIAITVIWLIIKEIVADKEVIENGVIEKKPKHPVIKPLFWFLIIISISFSLANFFRYVEAKEIPTSHTWDLIGIAWVIGLILKLISVWLEYRKDKPKVKKATPEGE